MIQRSMALFLSVLLCGVIQPSTALLGDRFGYTPRPRSGGSNSTGGTDDDYDPYHGEGAPTQGLGPSLKIFAFNFLLMFAALLGAWMETNSNTKWLGVRHWWNSKRSASTVEKKRATYRLGNRYLRWVTGLQIFADFTIYTKMSIPAKDFDLSYVAGGYLCTSAPSWMESVGTIRCYSFKEFDIITAMEGIGLGHSIAALLQMFILSSIRIFVLNGWIKQGSRVYTLLGWACILFGLKEGLSGDSSAVLVYFCLMWHLFGAAFMMKNDDLDGDGHADDAHGVALVALSPSSSRQQGAEADRRTAAQASPQDVV